ncbi:uncharacterized protein LOC123257697 [Drosophila ananassae]|uniref:uncharacterized protein LOC123257697 n=1 Tax=Drosophila ananassae TaxID=7217 RepID=UPI001CFFF8AE|nr:uncharacterized protein LOC123257697 [Drosophila ananassae]
MRDDCPAVCYPIVKPLLRYFEKVHEKDSHILQLQKDNSELLKKYAEVQKNNTEVLRQLNDLNVRYAKFQSQNLEVSHLHDLIGQKSGEIEQLKERITDLKRTSDLGVLSSQFRESIAKLEEMVKKGVKSPTKVANKSNRRKSQMETPVKTGDETETSSSSDSSDCTF